MGDRDSHTVNRTSLRSAIAVCVDLAETHYENFPVRTPFLSRKDRDDLASVYAFCRTTDDLGDEYPGDRLTALDAWDEAVRQALTSSRADSPVLRAVADTAARRALDPDLFLRLIEANRRDQSIRRYADESALLDYCHYSATPVGRMVLGIIGKHGEDLGRLADATCIGLQFANFWQDLRRDWEQARCYLPLDACHRHEVDVEVELIRREASPALRNVVAELVGRAREWLLRGWPLAGHLPTRWRPLIRGFSIGGLGICDAIEAQRFDTLSRRPRLSPWERRRIVALEMVRAPLREARPPGGDR